MGAGYQRVAADLRAAVSGGEYPPGSRLPSETELARRYGVARGTVRQALATLAAEGLVSTTKGARRLVLQQPRLQAFNELRSFSEWAQAMGETPGGRVVALVRREATPTEAEQLDTGRVYHLTRVRLLSGRAVMIERTAYPDRIGALVAGMDADHESITSRLHELGVLFANAAHTLSAVLATAEDARLLGIRPRAPLLRELRRSTDPEGAPLEWSEDRYLGEAVAFTVHNSVHQNTLIRGLA
jgi:GntR family transcriptional regulator